MFALKAFMKQKPYMTIFLALVATMLVFGYQLKVFEGPLSQVSGQDYNNY